MGTFLEKKHEVFLQTIHKMSRLPDIETIFRKTIKKAYSFSKNKIEDEMVTRYRDHILKKRVVFQ